MKDWISRYMSPFSTMAVMATARRRHSSRRPLPASVATARSASPGAAGMASALTATRSALAGWVRAPALSWPVSRRKISSRSGWDWLTETSGRFRLRSSFRKLCSSAWLVPRSVIWSQRLSWSSRAADRPGMPAGRAGIQCVDLCHKPY
jgi:hypothetical protein